MDLEKINNVWSVEGKDLKKPKILLAMDNDKNYYYVIKDNNSIVYVVNKRSTITYCIIKKNLKIVNDIYIIEDINKLVYINCSKKNNYENFVIKFLIT